MSRRRGSRWRRGPRSVCWHKPGLVGSQRQLGSRQRYRWRKDHPRVRQGRYRRPCELFRCIRRCLRRAGCWGRRLAYTHQPGKRGSPYIHCQIGSRPRKPFKKLGSVIRKTNAWWQHLLQMEDKSRFSSLKISSCQSQHYWQILVAVLPPRVYGALLEIPSLASWGLNSRLLNQIKLKVKGHF